MSVYLADSINYKQGVVLHPSYQYTRISPNEGAGNFPLTNSAGTTTTFKLISNVINLAKSSLNFTLQLPAQGANNYAWENINGLKPINSITVTPQQGPQLLQLNDLDRYIDSTVRKSTQFADLQSWDGGMPYANPSATGNPTFDEGLVPSNFSNGLVSARFDNTAVAKIGQEAEYVCVSGNNTAFYKDYKISFDKFLDTILSVDHDMYFRGGTLDLTIQWNPLAKYCWVGTSATNPTTGAAQLAVTNGANIIGPYISLAIEQNDVLVKEVKDRCLSKDGLVVQIPYLFQYAASTTTTSNVIQTQYGSNEGHHLKKVVWVAYQQSPATPNLVYDKSNLADAKISQFQTSTNGKVIQQNPFVPHNADDYMAYRDRLRGSAILSWNEFLYNWSYIDDFTEGRFKFLKDLFPDTPDENLVDGMPIASGQQITYQILSTSTSNIANYIFGVFLRNLRITGDLITLE